MTQRAHVMRHPARGFRYAIAAVSATVAISGCAIRYDHAGVSRVGVGLWGFGDPPGVDWNLDWPRSHGGDLPPAGTRELPPTPGQRRDRPDSAVPAHNGTTPAGPEGQTTAIDDNPGCADHRNPTAVLPPQESRMDPRTDRDDDRGGGSR